MTTTTRTRVPEGWWRAAAAYSAAVLLALVAGEAVVRLSTFEPAHWYPQITVKLGATPVRYMFVGSSRVGAGVNVTDFANAQPASPDGSPGHVFNNGHGFAAIVTHAIGLRKMSEAGLLRGATIFVEAAGGSPDEGTWRDRWYYREAPSFLLSVAGPRDLPGLWHSTMSVDEKLAASARTLMNGSTIAIYAEMIRVNGLAAAYRAATSTTLHALPRRRSARADGCSTSSAPSPIGTRRSSATSRGWCGTVEARWCFSRCR
ncbi:MAG: hypothetical protein O2917_04750 [Acidobacteria bacterium]|nr:hypothetical protein [Acidobacteriota bacterium]